jgi:elongation factor P
MLVVRKINSIVSSRSFATMEKAIKAVKPRSRIVLEGAPWFCTKIQQGKRGKGGGFVKASLKNLITGSTKDYTFSSDEQVEIAELEKAAASLSWSEGACLVFMDSETFEEIRVDSKVIDNAEYLSDGAEVKLLKFMGDVIGVELPTIAEFNVTSIEMVKSTGGNFPATLDSGASILVPSFIKVGERIRVNVEEGKYVERA